MTCCLVWVATPATPQTKIPLHPQPRATCFFDGRNFIKFIVPHIKACNFSLNFILSCIELVKHGFFWSKNALIAPLFSATELFTSKKEHFNLHILHYCWKMCEVVIATSQAWKCTAHKHIATLKKMGLYAHIATCYHTLQLATCYCTLQVILCYFD